MNIVFALEKKEESRNMTLRSTCVEKIHDRETLQQILILFTEFLY